MKEKSERDENIHHNYHICVHGANLFEQIHYLRMVTVRVENLGLTLIVAQFPYVVGVCEEILVTVGNWGGV